MSALAAARAAYARIKSRTPAAPPAQQRDERNERNEERSPPPEFKSPSPPEQRNERNERNDESPPSASGPSADLISSNSFISSQEYELITDADGLARVVAAVEDYGGAVGLDCETTGLDPRTDRVRLLQLAVGPTVFVIDVFRFNDPAAALAELFGVLGQVEIVAHNAAFDLRFLARLGFTPGRVFDTFLASKLRSGQDEIGSNRPKHDLAAAVKRHLQRDLAKTEQTSDWSKPLTEAQLRYAAADAAILLPLADRLRGELVFCTRVAELEMRAAPAVAWLQPVHLDAEAWAAIADRAKADQVRLAGELDALAPDPAGLPGVAARNWGSTDQIKAAFAALKVELTSTDDDTLAAIAKPARAVELAGKLREYRAAAKKANTYGRKWLAQHLVGGTILPTWNQLGAGTGRMSCSDPNLQQIPRGEEYRRCFVARPGHVLVKADYSQIELRIAATIAIDAGMIEAYRTGADLHTRTAAAVLGKPESAVGKADRQLAKVVNFGLLFGAGAKGLMQYAQATYGVTLTPDEARRFKAAFFATYPGLAKWHEQTRAAVQRLAATAAYQTVTRGGRPRWVPSHKRTTAAGGHESYPNVTEALNSPVQGTGADGLKIALALLWERREECPGAVPVLVCHDEIVVETPADQADRTAAWLTRCMADGMAPLIAPVPVSVEVSIGSSWGG